MKRIIRMSIIGVFAVFLSGCGSIEDALGDMIKNSLFGSTEVYLVPDNDTAGITSELDMDTNILSLTKASVIVDINHTRSGDLRLWVVSPRGTKVVLSENNGGDTNGFHAFFSDDDDDDLITEVRTEINGGYRPEENLSIFNGEDPNGIWKLHVSDTVMGNTGMLTSWSMMINGNNE